MKKIFTILFAVSAIFAAFSCAELDAPTVSPEDGQTPDADLNGEYTNLTITATATKSYLDEIDGQIVHRWNMNDFIHVFDEQGRCFIFTGESAAASSFVFNCENWPVGAEPKYAVFCPESNPTALGEGKFKATHPSRQRISNAGSFGRNANTSVAKIEKTPEGKYTAEFKNICGLIKFTLATTYVENILIESVDETPIAGDIVIDYNNGEPTYVMDEEGSGRTSVSITPRSSGDQYTKGSYYACLLPCDLKGIKVTITNINKRKEVITGSALMKIQRGKQIPIGTLDQRTIDMQFTGENRYDLPIENSSEEGTHTVNDNFGIGHDFIVKPFFKYIHNSTTGLTFVRHSDESFKGSNKNYIGLPVFESRYLSYAKVELVNTSAKPMYLYAETGSGADYPSSFPVAGKLQPKSGGPKYWNFGEGDAIYTENVDANNDGSLDKTIDVTPDGLYVITPKTHRNTRYWLLFHNDPVQVKYVQLTYTFTSEGPDAPETPAE